MKYLHSIVKPLFKHNIDIKEGGGLYDSHSLYSIMFV